MSDLYRRTAPPGPGTAGRLGSMFVVAAIGFAVTSLCLAHVARDRLQPLARVDALDRGLTRPPTIPIEVTWLLKNPFGASAQPGQRGDFVRVSDDRATIYMLPNEFDHADERTLRWLLAQQPTRAS